MTRRPPPRLPRGATPASLLRTRVLAELRWHRRPIAAGLAALALFAALGARTGSEPSTTAAVVAVRSVAAGEPVPASALALLDVPTALVPHSALTDMAEAVGRPAALPLTRGEVLTEARVLGPGLLDALGADGDVEGTADLVAAPVTLADPSADGLLRVGDTVDVLAAGEAGTPGVVAASARVLRAPRDDSSLLSTDGASSLVVAVPARTAVALARAAATARLSVVVRSSAADRTDGIGVR